MSATAIITATSTVAALQLIESQNKRTEQLTEQCSKLIQAFKPEAAAKDALTKYIEDYEYYTEDGPFDLK